MQSGPLVVDTHELGRQPGNERTYHLDVAAPARLGYDVFGVAEGADLDIELRLESVLDGVLATGTASALATGECVRCLKEVEEHLDVDFQELYLHEPDASDDGDEESYQLEGDQLDLGPVLTDAVVLALPHNPLCDPECPGLCPECGARLADDPDHAHGPAIDPRWTKLTGLGLTDNETKE